MPDLGVAFFRPGRGSELWLGRPLPDPSPMALAVEAYRYLVFKDPELGCLNSMRRAICDGGQGDWSHHDSS